MHFIHNIKQIDGRISLEITTYTCPGCHRLILPDFLAKGREVGFAFNADSVVKDESPEVAILGDYFDGKFYCRRCSKRLNHTVQCVICGVERSEDEWEEEFGVPREIMCSACYSSVPAKQWIEVKQRLYEEHAYGSE